MQLGGLSPVNNRELAQKVLTLPFLDSQQHSKLNVDMMEGRNYLVLNCLAAQTVILAVLERCLLVVQDMAAARDANVEL